MLRDRLRSIYKRLVSAKHISKGQELDLLEAQAQTKELCNLALTRHVKLMLDLDTVASNGLMFLFRVLAAGGTELSSEAVVEAYAPVLEDLIAKKRGKISKPKILEDVITRYPIVGSCLAPLLIEYCVSVEGDRVVPRTLFQRHLCLVLLSNLVKRVPSTFSLDPVCECFVRLCRKNPFEKKQHVKTLMSLGQTLIRTRNGSVTKEMIELIDTMCSNKDASFTDAMVRSAGIMSSMLSQSEASPTKRKKMNDNDDEKKKKKRKIEDLGNDSAAKKSKKKKSKKKKKRKK